MHLFEVRAEFHAVQMIDYVLTDKSILNLIMLNLILIVITLFRLIFESNKIQFGFKSIGKW